MSGATTYSEKLVEAFESSLPFNWKDVTPELIHVQITENHIYKLQENLKDLFRSKIRDDAIYDLETYNKRTNSIQTTGIGLASTIHTFVNLGLLLGTRVVLWDTVIINIFFPDNGQLLIDDAVNVALELMLLKQAIKNGNVVMLPHPAYWLERCQRYFSAVSNLDGISPSFQGYLHSRALLDEGFELHPYTMSQGLSHNGKTKEIESSINLMDDCHKQKNFKKSEICARNLIFDVNFDYVNNIDSYKLSEFLDKHDAWRKDLHSKLVVPDYIKTSNDLARHLEEVKNTIQDGVQSHNTQMKNKSSNLLLAKFGSVGAGLGIVAGTIGLATAGTPLTAIGAGIGVLGGGVSSIPAFLALSKVIGDTKSETVSLYQGFTVLKKLSEQN